MNKFPEQRAIISGLGISRIGRRSGLSGLELTLESTRAAIADAGLTPADIDGIASLGDTAIDDTASALGISSSFRSEGYGRGGLHSPAMAAFQAVGLRQVRHVLVYRTVAMLGGSVAPPPGASSDAGAAVSQRAPDFMSDVGALMAYHAFSASNWLAMHCQRHMYLYGTTKEQLGWLAINSRRNAALNPLAVYREPITMADYLGARTISSPFGLLDCDVPVDGSIALVVSIDDYAADCPNDAIHVEAIGGSDGLGGWIRRPDYPKMASSDAAAEMWSRTDLTAGDLDIAQLYDGFSFLTLAWLEALGICGEGESGPFIEGGSRIALDGALPLNTYGGQLSAGRMHGYWVLHEACLQLRGQAGERQVPGRPEVAVAANGGGPIAGCVLLTR